MLAYVWTFHWLQIYDKFYKQKSTECVCVFCYGLSPDRTLNAFSQTRVTLEGAIQASFKCRASPNRTSRYITCSTSLSRCRTTELQMPIYGVWYMNLTSLFRCKCRASPKGTSRIWYTTSSTSLSRCRTTSDGTADTFFMECWYMMNLTNLFRCRVILNRTTNA